MENENRKLPLSNNKFVFLTLYFSLLLIIATILSICSFCINHAEIDSDILPSLLKTADGKKINILSFSLVAGFFTNITGCSIFYIRKLYKLALSDSLLMTSTDANFKLKQYASILYFITRPLYSICFSCVTLTGVNAGLLNVSSTITLNNTFCDLIMFINFFIGFATGNFLTLIKDVSSKILCETFQNVSEFHH